MPDFLYNEAGSVEGRCLSVLIARPAFCRRPAERFRSQFSRPIGCLSRPLQADPRRSPLRQSATLMRCYRFPAALLTLLAVTTRLGPSLAIADNASPFEFSTAQQLLKEHCVDCHDGDAAEAGFAIQALASPPSLSDELERWSTVKQRIADGSMPPIDAAPMPGEDRQQIVAWIERATLEAVCADGPQPGPPMLRRLTKHEYSNSIRDLLGIHFDAGHALPQDSAGGEGFSNAAETLTISPIHAEKYLDAAVDALAYAARSEEARNVLLVDQPSESRTATEAAKQNLRRLADRAYRRPIDEAELERLVALFHAAADDGLDFDEALFYAMRAVLVSPHFLFIAETPPPDAETAPLSDHELATRLSYFLWASMPDEELRRIADAGRLHDEGELEKQVLRMIGGEQTHFRDSMSRFVGQWLGTADLGTAKQIDRQRHDWIRDPHVAGLRDQPVYVFESIIRENDSLLDLIDADWTFLNNELVQVYRMERDKIEQEFVQRLVRVDLPEEYRRRGGLLGMGGVHVISSYPSRSSPVLRGVWVLEKLLGAELPPPPPNVPELADDAGVAEASTLRKRLEQHRADPSCASCHASIDPIGFTLENYDEIGRWRTKDDGGDIEATASLRDGTELAGVEGLKAHLLQQKDMFIRHLTRKMLGYALGRALQPSDLCTVESIVENLRQNDYRGQGLVLGIVTSKPFRMKGAQP